MPSNPLPSSARSALREAALRAIQADADAELADDAPGEGADGACRVAFADFHNACEPETILALLEESERANGVKPVCLTCGGHGFYIAPEIPGVTHSKPRACPCGTPIAMTAGAWFASPIVASSPTGGTTE